MWLAEGFSFGITAAGGTGHYLAQMMTEGEAEIDMASLDPRRYGGWMTTEYAARKNEECYSHVFVLHHPDEEREACRPLRTAPCYDRVKARGAQFGQVNGFERPNYYAPQGFDDHASRSFRRGGWWPYAVEEARAIRETVGLIDASAFTKHVVKGPGATAFLDWFTTNRLPKIGRLNLTYALTATGTTRTEYTIARTGEDAYYLVSAGAWTAYDADYLRKAAEDRARDLGAVEIQDVTTQIGVFAVAGPKARALLQSLIRDPDPATALSNRRFPWLAARRIELLMCPVHALRVAYTGELGWELHHPIEMQNYLFDRLMEAGEPHGLKLVGARAQNWLRQEKSYRAFGTELGRDATPLEADLPRFVDLGKEFHGKAAMLAHGIRSKCVTLLIDGPAGRRPLGPRGALCRREPGWAPHLRRLFGRLRQVDRAGLCRARARRGRHTADGADAGPALARRDRPGQPLRPGECAHPRGRIAGSPPVTPQALLGRVPPDLKLRGNTHASQPSRPRPARRGRRRRPGCSRRRPRPAEAVGRDQDRRAHRRAAALLHRRRTASRPAIRYWSATRSLRRWARWWDTIR